MGKLPVHLAKVMGVVAVSLALLLAPSSAAPSVAIQHAFSNAAAAGEKDPSSYTVARGNYVAPHATLVDRHGNKVQLADLLAQPRPVLMEFIFTTCTTVCPILSATFSQAQESIGRLSKDYLMISVSIDPEYDTPKRLDEYARRYHPGANWLFLTGSRQDIARVLRAFDALYLNNNKMYHRPYILLRAPHGGSWVKLEGFPSVEDLLKEYQGALRAPPGRG